MIKVKNLTKQFPEVKAVDNISFKVNKGEIFGLIGPNGAGKTTCLNIMATLLQPTSGEIFIDGLNINENIREVRKKTGYMPDFFGTYKNLTIEEYLDFYGGCYGVPFDKRMRRIDEVIALSNLETKKDELVDNLSRGMKQRLCLAKTLLHEPTLLLLDEPASGLDPRARREIRDILKDVATTGTTILISSHILTDLENVCTDIAIMEKGKLVKYAKIDELLKQEKSTKTWLVEIDGDLNKASKALKQLNFIAKVDIAGNTITITPKRDSDDISSKILQTILQDDCQVIKFSEETINLEDAYLNYTEGLLS